MGTARRYNLEMNSVIACGIGSYTGNTVTCSLLNPFLIVYDTVPQTSHYYPPLTTVQLQSLSTVDYDKRVIDFLDYINIESGISKEILYSASTTNEPACNNYYCLLNPNFLVYKFLSGVRVVNVGSANGEVQYRVSGDTYDSGWQNNGTFLSLDPNGVFIVTIRDYISELDYVVCEQSTTISMQILIPSTTITLASKIIALNQIAAGSSGPAVYKTGCIQVNPSVLSPGERVLICYTSMATLAGNGGTSCVQLTCQPNGCSGFVNYDCLTNLGVSPHNGSLTLCYGDIVCYNVTAVAGTYGANACANLCLTSVNGLGTIVPTIDITKCSASSTSCQAPLGVTVGMTRTACCYPSTCTYLVRGTINFTPAIPTCECVNVGLSAVTATVGGNAVVNFFCKPNGGASYLLTCTVNSSQPQPQLPILTSRYGDSLCYVATISATCPGTCTTERMCVNNLTATIGVNPIKSTTGNSEYSCINNPPLPVVVAICQANNYGTSSNGFINVNPVMNVCSQCVTVCYETNQKINGYGSGVITVLCKPNGGASYLSYCTITTSYPQTCGHTTGSFVIRYGDTICYNNQVSTSNPGSCSSFCINSVVGTSDLLPTICSTKCKECVTN